MDQPQATQKRKRLLTPMQRVTISFLVMILVGAVLLTLPIASQSGESAGFLNALFTATSANCVTGLVVYNTLAQWTMFGKLVILALIQLGGLGLMTVVTLAMVMMHRRISLRDRQIIQTSFNQDTIGGMVQLVRRIIRITLYTEGAGALLLTGGFLLRGMPFMEALWKGVFHSISAFCNAGFDILGPDSLVPYQNDWLINIAIMSLIVIGGLGFTTLGDFVRTIRRRKGFSLRIRLTHLTLHTKLAVSITIGLLLFGMTLFLILEGNNPATLGPLPPAEKALGALFQSVTLRTAGFNTIDQAAMSEASQFVSCLLMVIGGSPAGTAGGIKTVTLGVVLFAMLSAIKGRGQVEAYGRTIPLDLLQKALTVLGALLTVVLVSTLILCISERAGGHTFMSLLFEVCSGVGTVGVTTGVTPQLSAVGKVVLILCMFLGRLGPLTVAMSLNMRLSGGAGELRYPDERVLIG